MRKYICFVLLVVSLFIGCNDDLLINEDLSNHRAIYKIMPLGASRVDGARPDFESYRFELWKDLVQGGWSFDFIGTRNDDANYPMSYDDAFDRDHEGRGGWTSGQIRDGLSEWIEAAGVPDIVLLSSPGGNDALQNLSYDNALSNIKAIIDILQESNPRVTVIVEQMAPGQSSIMTGRLAEYFESMHLDIVEIANNKSNSMSSVIVVNMFTGFSDDLLADQVHYNEDGAAFIADRYYAVLKQILRGER